MYKKHTSSMDVSHNGLDLTVHYEYYPPCRGARERSSGIQLEPDEPATVEILSLTTSDNLIDIFENELDDIATKIHEELQEGFYDETE